MILTNGVIHVQHHFPDSIVVFRPPSCHFSNPAFFSWSALVILWIGHPPLSSPVALAQQITRYFFLNIGLKSTYEGMSYLWRYVILIKVCHTYEL